MSLPNFLKLHRELGGFPLSLDPSNPTTVEKDSQLKLSRTAVISLASAAIYVFVYWQAHRSYGLSLDLYEVFAEAFGTSVFQIYMVTLLSWMVITASIISVSMYIYKRKEICEIYGDIYAMYRRIGMSQIKNVGGCFGAKKAILWATCCCLSFAFGWPLYTWACHLAYADSRPDDASTWSGLALVVVLGFDRCWCLCNPMIASIVIISLDVMAALGDMFQAWTELMGDLNTTTKVPQKVLKEHIMLGRATCGLVKKANDVMSPLIMLFYVYFLFGGILYMYGACDILFSEGKIKFQALIISCVFVIFGLIWFYAIALYSHGGQSLLDRIEEARDSFNNMFLDHYEDDMSITLRNGWKCVTDQLASTCLSPYGYFQVRNSGLLAMTTTVLTYLIIVLQFRAA